MEKRIFILPAYLACIYISLCLSMFFFNFSCKSYDGSGPGYGGLNEPPNGARLSHTPPATSTGGSTSSSASSGRSRLSSSGATKHQLHHGHKDIRHSSSSSCSTAVSGINLTSSGALSNQNTKMADLNLARGHSPNFSPSRSACNITL